MENTSLNDNSLTTHWLYKHVKKLLNIFVGQWSYIYTKKGWNPDYQKANVLSMHVSITLQHLTKGKRYTINNIDIYIRICCSESESKPQDAPTAARSKMTSSVYVTHLNSIILVAQSGLQWKLYSWHFYNTLWRQGISEKSSDPIERLRPTVLTKLQYRRNEMFCCPSCVLWALYLFPLSNGIRILGLFPHLCLPEYSFSIQSKAHGKVIHECHHCVQMSPALGGVQQSTP